MRILTAELAEIQLSLERQPAWKIEIYDLRSEIDTMQDIVLDNPLSAITGPRDFTGDVLKWSKTEVASDFSTTGIAVPAMEIFFADPGIFDPLLLVDDPGGDGRWLRKGNALRLSEGDARVDQDDWPITFTGKLVGQAGVDLNRTDGGRAQTVMRALGREADFINTPITSKVYSFGASYKSIVEDIAGTNMGLDSDEFDFTTFGSTANGHLSLQFVDLPPLVAIANLMMLDGLMPRFNGEGKLSQSLGLITQSPDRFYDNFDTIRSIVRPYTDDQIVNSVIVLGLDANKQRIDSPKQKLLEINVTTGFFTQGERIEVFWGEDERLLADKIQFKVIKSVNTGLFILGDGEEFELIPSATGEGSIGAVITISTGYAGTLILFLMFTYVGLAALPDTVLAAFGGITLPVGRIIQAAALAASLQLMSKIGRGQYQFFGEPLEYVFREIKATAELPGLTSETRDQITIENQSIQDQTAADNVARNTLFRLQALASVREIETMPDLTLEPDDVFQVDGRKFQIQNVTRTGQRARRGESPSVTSNANCAELTAVGIE